MERVVKLLMSALDGASADGEILKAISAARIELKSKNKSIGEIIQEGKVLTIVQGNSGKILEYASKNAELTTTNEQLVRKNKFLNAENSRLRSLVESAEYSQTLKSLQTLKSKKIKDSSTGVKSASPPRIKRGRTLVEEVIDILRNNPDRKMVATEIADILHSKSIYLDKSRKQLGSEISRWHPQYAKIDKITVHKDKILSFIYAP
jgi:hypothetical protein